MYSEECIAQVMHNIHLNRQTCHVDLFCKSMSIMTMSLLLLFMPPQRSERRHYVHGLSVRPSGCPAVRPSGHVFLYYANMVQQIEFIIFTNIQPLRQKFFTKGQGQGYVIAEAYN